MTRAAQSVWVGASGAEASAEGAGASATGSWGAVGAAGEDIRLLDAALGAAAAAGRGGWLGRGEEDAVVDLACAGDMPVTCTRTHTRTCTHYLSTA